MLRITRRPLKLGNSVCHGKSGKEKKGRNNQAFWKTPVVHKAGAGPFPDERQGRSRGSTGREPEPVVHRRHGKGRYPPRPRNSAGS